ncbi:S8 family serine peptidase [Brevibacillus migulae]|uniref:S8 family serine peptidase n=1 Tax=Brevibacillus migulae TaxID=1644114 RepID=UPI00106ECB4B|nr:S8 family serine peptidase [Brevibacillus migulae]
MQMKEYGRKLGKIAVAFSLFTFVGQAGIWAHEVRAETSSPSIPSSETGEYIIKMKKTASALSAKSMLSAKGASVLSVNNQRVVMKLDKASEQEALTSLSSNPSVEYIEPNIKMHTFAEIADPSYSKQWGLRAIHAAEAWAEATNTEEVTVAVLDTGVDYTHPDLANRVDTKHDYDYINGDSDAMDDNGHGTHVSGILAAELNKVGIAGTAGPIDVKLLPLKVLDDEGDGDLYHVAMAIEDAVDLGADVINLSLGGYWNEEMDGKPRTMIDAVEYAMDKGAVVIAAAGNEKADADYFIPASIPDVITVSAVNENLKLTNFSNFGDSIDIAAPGEDILSTWPGGGYVYESGTSMATPFVSGAAALLKAQNPDLDPEELTDLLLEGTTDLGAKGDDDLYGEGLLNIYQAWQDGADDVENSAPVLEKISASSKKLTLKPGAQSQLSVNAYYSDDSKKDITSEVQWDSQNERVAVVENGLVTAKGFGKTNITADFGGKTLKIPVEITVSSLKASTSRLSLKPVGTATIQIMATYGDKSTAMIDPDEIEWSSNDESVATVADGVVSAHNVGRTYITASYGGKAVKVSVTIQLTKLEASSSKLLMKPDDASLIKLSAVYGSEKEEVTEEATWKTSNDDVAEYQDGQIVTTGFGKATITATYRGKSTNISVDTTLKKLAADATKKTLKLEETYAPTLEATYRDDSEDEVTADIDWSSSNEKVATVDEEGLITAVAEGRATITAKYGGKTVRISITVTD